MENYLEAIYELSLEHGSARVSDIAVRLNVTKASTNSAMNTLAEKGLIRNEKYREIYLTNKGYDLARLTAKKHKIIKEYLTSVLGIEEAIADDDACAIEHVISSESVQAMEAALKQNS
jgi:Mn-dependent DtxR family transcriptional regulator